LKQQPWGHVENYTTKEIVKNGSICYYNSNGQFHRLDGPAIVWTNGTKEWLINNKRHRESGPAIEYNNGTKFWYLNDKIHRLNGPAVEWESGLNNWSLCDKLCPKASHNRLVLFSILEPRRIDINPAKE
jgi:hypothetical protein